MGTMHIWNYRIESNRCTCTMHIHTCIPRSTIQSSKSCIVLRFLCTCVHSFHSFVRSMKNYMNLYMQVYKLQREHTCILHYIITTMLRIITSSVCMYSGQTWCRRRRSRQQSFVRYHSECALIASRHFYIYISTMS